MSMTKEGYKARLIDKKVARYLKIFGAVSIEGPKWCGKTWTSLNHANSVTYLTDNSARNLAEVDPKYIFKKERPQLIDEWQVVPQIWDAVRHECDSDSGKGKFILTGSTSLEKKRGEKKVYHTGTGRIAPLRMHPMSLYESGDSTGEASLLGMRTGEVKEGYVRKVELYEIARLLVRGGWPENIDMDEDDIGTIPESYIALRNVRRAPYASSTLDVEGTAAAFSLSSPILIVDNKCVIVAGNSLLNAFDKLEVLEYSAKAVIACKDIGEIVHISPEEVSAIEEAFHLK